MAASLLSAVATCRFKQVRLLLKHHVSVNSKSVTGQTALLTSLHIDDDAKRERMFCYLLAKGARCDTVESATGKDILSWACYLGRTDQVRDLLEHTVNDLDLTHRDNHGYTALHHATINNHSECVRLVIEAMKKIHISVDVSDGENLTPYLQAIRHGHADIANILVHQGGASKNKNGGIVYKDANEWRKIGQLENAQREKLKFKKQRELLLIQGKMPMLRRLANGTLLPIPRLEVTNVNERTEPISRVIFSHSDTIKDLAKLKPETITSKRLYVSLPNIPFSDKEGKQKLKSITKNLGAIMEAISIQKTTSFRPTAAPKVNATPVLYAKRQRRLPSIQTLSEAQMGGRKRTSGRISVVRIPSNPKMRRHSQPPTKAPNPEKLLDKSMSYSDLEKTITLSALELKQSTKHATHCS